MRSFEGKGVIHLEITNGFGLITIEKNLSLKF
jgi:hypothetical protein